MRVEIFLDNDKEPIETISIEGVDGRYEYSSSSDKDFHGTIYNHQGDYLNLLEKILHGRNLS